MRAQSRAAVRAVSTFAQAATSRAKSPLRRVCCSTRTRRCACARRPAKLRSDSAQRSRMSSAWIAMPGPQRRQVKPAERRNEAPERPQHRLAQRSRAATAAASSRPARSGSAAHRERSRRNTSTAACARSRSATARTHAAAGGGSRSRRSQYSMRRPCTIATRSTATTEAVSILPIGGSTRRSGRISGIGEPHDRLAERVAEVGARPLQQQARQHDEQRQRQQRVDDEDDRAHACGCLAGSGIGSRAARPARGCGAAAAAGRAR